LPSLNQRARDPQLATQLRGCELASQHPIDLLSLEFGREQTPAIRTAGCFHCTLRSPESVSFEGVSLNWGSKQLRQLGLAGAELTNRLATRLDGVPTNPATNRDLNPAATPSASRRTMCNEPFAYRCVVTSDA